METENNNNNNTTPTPTLTLADSVPADSVTVSEGDIDALITAAEKRGYLRGRNEALDLWMQQPPVLRDITPTTPPADYPPQTLEQEFAETFLSDLRPDIWD